MTKNDLEQIKSRLSVVYGLKSSYAFEDSSIGVVYIHNDAGRPDSDRAINSARNYINERYPKVNIVIYDKQ